MTEASVPPAETDVDTKERSDKLRKAYGEANTALREKHRDEFEALYVEKAAAYGIEYKPKPTKEQKAEAELAALLAANPALKERLVAEITETVGVVDGGTPAKAAAKK